MDQYPDSHQSSYKPGNKKREKVRDYIASHPEQHVSPKEISEELDVSDSLASEVMTDLEECGWVTITRPDAKKLATWNNHKIGGHRADHSGLSGIYKILSDIYAILYEYTRTMNRAQLLFGIFPLVASAVNFLTIPFVSLVGPVHLTIPFASSFGIGQVSVASLSFHGIFFLIIGISFLIFNSIHLMMVKSITLPEWVPVIGGI